MNYEYFKVLISYLSLKLWLKCKFISYEQFHDSYNVFRSDRAAKKDNILKNWIKRTYQMMRALLGVVDSTVVDRHFNSYNQPIGMLFGYAI